MDLGLKGKVALVTGGSAGIGLGIADKLAREGCKLVICGRNQQNIKQTESWLIQQIPDLEILSLSADVQKYNQSEKLVNEALEKFGKIDILINNSQGASFSSDAVEKISDDDWRMVFEAKLMGYIRMTNLVLPTMKNQNWGRIINIIGTSGKEPSARLIKSGVANAGLINFTKSVSAQAAQFNVLITAINPGLIDTPRHRQYLEIAAQEESRTPDDIKARIAKSIPVGRLGSSEEVANLVLFLASECASYITGVTIPIDGGLSTSAF